MNPHHYTANSKH